MPDSHWREVQDEKDVKNRGFDLSPTHEDKSSTTPDQKSPTHEDKSSTTPDQKTPTHEDKSPKTPDEKNSEAKKASIEKENDIKVNIQSILKGEYYLKLSYLKINFLLLKYH